MTETSLSAEPVINVIEQDIRGLPWRRGTIRRRRSYPTTGRGGDGGRVSPAPT